MDFSSYDSWRLDNDEPSTFKCPECDWKKDIDELADNGEMCEECHTKIMEEGNE